MWKSSSLRSWPFSSSSLDFLEVEFGEFDFFRVAVDDEAVAPDGQADAQPVLELLQVPVQDAEKDIFPDKGMGDFFHIRMQETVLRSLPQIINTYRLPLSRRRTSSYP